MHGTAPEPAPHIERTRTILTAAATVTLLAAALAGAPVGGDDHAGYGSGVRKGHPSMGYLDPL